MDAAPASPTPPPMGKKVLVALGLAALAGVILFVASITKAPSLPPSTAGEAVDNATYAAITMSLRSMPYGNPTAAQKNLRSYDIDGDGDKDVLGAALFSFEGYMGAPGYDEYRLMTWHQQNGQYVYYEPGYKGYKFTKENSCAITALALKKVTLSCTTAVGPYVVALGYQPNGEGYYRLAAEHAISYGEHPDWAEYKSPHGVAFFHAPDILIDEKTYEIGEKPVSILKGLRDGAPLFEIHTAPSDGLDEGGGLIDPYSKVIFIRLADGSYLTHQVFEPGIGGYVDRYYRKASLLEVNNVGSLFDAYDISNVSNGRSVLLYFAGEGQAASEEVDQIFASLRYTPAVSGTDVIRPPESTITIGTVATVVIKGELKEVEPNDYDAGLLKKQYAVSFPDSPVYTPSYITLTVLPFETAGRTSGIGGGGYDAAQKACFGYERDSFSEPVAVGPYKACRFGFGDGGESNQGYYFLDPNGKYIVQLRQDISHSGGQLYVPDFEAIAGSFRFLP